MEIKKDDYVRDMAGNIARVDFIVDYKRTDPTYYLLTGNIVAISNDLYIDSDDVCGRHEKIVNAVPAKDRYQLIEMGDLVGDIRGMYEIVGKTKGMITTDNGITRYIDLIDGIDVLTKEKIENNKIHF